MSLPPHTVTEETPRLSNSNDEAEHEPKGLILADILKQINSTQKYNTWFEKTVFQAEIWHVNI